MLQPIFSVTGGELFERIADDTFDLTEQLAVVYLRQICEAISYMHSVNILHLDLKVTRRFYYWRM